MKTRYQDAYRAGSLTEGLGATCKVVGFLMGGVILLVSFAGGQLSGAFLVLGLGAGALIAFVGWVLGVLVSAQGRMLKATLDTAVNSSPFLSNAERAEVMSYVERR